MGGGGDPVTNGPVERLGAMGEPELSGGVEEDGSGGIGGGLLGLVYTGGS